ncbi:prolyl oligopeptidase family protein [Neorickettsia helminthoeca str. Oregon]|uniref:Prolyl oligopeptidase family protein n=1 Tax=Neorickettsia helminthoeca str. Oregon TaxID=1286528 RepID=X5H497_9RICK|nr:alpha/beta fold hydrolase [Neorickettsia helminthoeca]AHX11391.1 prolyl oligopeptidase family protein [Neorickettsia helminthoeca str. Oregon]
MQTKYLDTSHGRIAYQTFDNNPEVGVLFMTGLASDMSGRKSERLRSFCENNQVAFTRFDYFGHGRSEGSFLHGNISKWTENALEVLERVTTGKQILVGSSMSGWMMFKIAEKHPEKVKGLVGIAAAPDFTEDFLEGLTHETKQALEKNGYFTFTRNRDEKLVITKTLLDDGKKNLILTQRIKVPCPVVLLHGLADDIVSYRKSIELAELIESSPVEVRLIKGADHSMSDPTSITVLTDTVRALI